MDNKLANKLELTTTGHHENRLAMAECARFKSPWSIIFFGCQRAPEPQRLMLKSVGWIEVKANAVVSTDMTVSLLLQKQACRWRAVERAFDEAVPTSLVRRGISRAEAALRIKGLAA
ncbi:hypothetical protein [Ensifer sp. YR511]|uniref:hypothetical protein n=1 Tax=Ensifer sp. YR511 TaxID=1855294 RepID=UPI000891824C|nr:hypothetical protein [Ensifer sp. YR511]SDN04142.1 hypothetical protein SAMN05216328_11773 [Ensifer sp. YR511]